MLQSLLEIKSQDIRFFFFFLGWKMGAFMVILHPRAGRWSEVATRAPFVGVNHAYPTAWGVNPTKDAHQRTPAGSGTRIQVCCTKRPSLTHSAKPPLAPRILAGWKGFGYSTFGLTILGFFFHYNFHIYLLYRLVINVILIVLKNNLYYTV